MGSLFRDIVQRVKDWVGGFRAPSKGAPAPRASWSSAQPRPSAQPRSSTQPRSNANKKRTMLNRRTTIAGVASLLVIALVIVGITALVRRGGGNVDPELELDPQLPVEQIINPPEEYVQLPNEGEEKAVDISGEAEVVKTTYRSVDIPGVYGDELIYSSGEGSFDKPVLKDLFLYDINTGTETLVASSTVERGEIYESLINDKYVVWVDTDQLGTNLIYMKNRDDLGGESILIKECENQKPKLRMYGNTLVWIEQTDEMLDRLFLFDMEYGEDISLTNLPEAASYGVSAPSVYGNQVIWASYDPDQTYEDAELNGENSCIYMCELNKLGDENAERTAFPEPFKPGMYVHEPVNNADAWAWIDKNKAPDSGLFIRYGGRVQEVARGSITTYGLGDGFLMYGRNETVWAYFYRTGEYVRLSDPNEKAKLPVVNGDRVVWFIDSDSKSDILKTIKVTAPTADGAATDEKTIDLASPDASSPDASSPVDSAPADATTDPDATPEPSASAGN